MAIILQLLDAHDESLRTPSSEICPVPGCQRPFQSPRDLIDHVLSDCFERLRGEWQCSDPNCKHTHELKRWPISLSMMSPVQLLRRISGGRKRGRNADTESGEPFGKRGRADLTGSLDGWSNLPSELGESTAATKDNVVAEFNYLSNVPRECYALALNSTPVELDARLPDPTGDTYTESSASAMSSLAQQQQWSAMTQDSTLYGDSPDQELQKRMSTGFMSPQAIVRNKPGFEHLYIFHDPEAIDPMLISMGDSSRKDCVNSITSNIHEAPWSAQSLQHQQLSSANSAQDDNSVERIPRPDSYTISSPGIHGGSASQPRSACSYGHGTSPDSGYFGSLRRQSAPQISDTSEIFSSTRSFAHGFNKPVSSPRLNFSLSMFLMTFRS